MTDMFLYVHHIDRNTEQEDKATHASLPDHVPVVKVNNPDQDCEEDDMFFLRMSPSQPSEAFVNETPFRRNSLVTKGKNVLSANVHKNNLLSNFSSNHVGEASIISQQILFCLFTDMTLRTVEGRSIVRNRQTK